MSNVSRIKASLKNIIVGMVGQFFNQILGFITRTVFIQILGEVYLGINGLFSNILSILSLVELGVGSAIIFSLYEPLAKKDISKTKALMNLYSKAYNVIGFTIFVLGVVLIPFLRYLINDKPDIPHFIIIYILFLLNTSITYFFSYKRSILSADQKDYINVINNNIFSFITKIFQMIVLIITRNFIVYLSIQIIFMFLSNVAISIRANKEYPFLKYKIDAKLSKEDLKDIKKNISAMFLLKIGGVVVNGTDNLLISSFVGIVSVGLYSNYVLIIGIIQGFINLIFTSITASVGNLVNLENENKALDVFYKIFFMNFIIYGFCCICLFVLINPFIQLWIGEEYLLSTSVVFFIILNVYIMGIRRVLWVYTNALGLFHHFRYIPFIEATINIVVSIYLLKKIGIAGVFLGTFASTVTTYLIAEPYVLYKNYFKAPLHSYYKKYFIYIIIMFMTGSVDWFILSFINSNSWLGFFIKAFLTFAIISLAFVLIFHRTKEYKFFTILIKKHCKLI